MRSLTSSTAADSVGACCAAMYGHPAARFLLGDSFHPGGLDLTNDLACHLGITSDDTVLDAGCGPGASALHLAQAVGCTVVGVTLEESAAVEAGERARGQGVEHLVHVIQGDVHAMELGEGRFDAAIAECVMSILPRKPEAAARIHRLLRHGGRFGMTDVTVDGELPAELAGVLAVVGCVGDALPLDGYASLLSEAGFDVQATEDLPRVAAVFIEGIGRKLLMAEVAAKLGKLPIGVETVLEAKRYLRATQSLIEEGTLGYAMVIARKG